MSNTDGIVGSVAGSTGTVNVSGGTWTNSGNLTIGSAGNGTLNLTGNGTVSVGSGLVTLADSSGKTGTLNLGNGTSAGTLSAATITGGNGTAGVNINQSGSYNLGSERSRGATAPIGNANVPIGFARHVSRAEEDLSVPKKAPPFSRAWPSVGCGPDAQQ